MYLMSWFKFNECARSESLGKDKSSNLMSSLATKELVNIKIDCQEMD